MKTYHTDINGENRSFHIAFLLTTVDRFTNGNSHPRIAVFLCLFLGKPQIITPIAMRYRIQPSWMQVREWIEVSAKDGCWLLIEQPNG